MYILVNLTLHIFMIDKKKWNWFSGSSFKKMSVTRKLLKCWKEQGKMSLRLEAVNRMPFFCAQSIQLSSLALDHWSHFANTQQFGGVRVEKPSLWAIIFKFFRQIKENKWQSTFVIFSLHAPGLPSPGSGPWPYSKCSKTVEVGC